MLVTGWIHGRHDGRRDGHARARRHASSASRCPVYRGVDASAVNVLQPRCVVEAVKYVPSIIQFDDMYDIVK